jgi:hypothetical protein
MNTDKRDFIQTGFLNFVQQLHSGQTGNWGKMNAQQMAEHVTAFFKLSSGRLVLPVLTPADQLPKLKVFLMSNREFRENTKAPKEVIGDDPLPLRYENMDTAISKMQQSISEFFYYFANDSLKTSSHPVFGPLNFEEWILLHYKHVLHHAKQFGYSVPAD